MRFLDRHAGLYTDYYELAMAQGYFLAGMAEKRACFDYFFRKLPYQGGYTIFAGLYDLLELLQDFTFDKEDLDYLKKRGFDASFLAYLERFKFNGSVFSVQEGEVIFPTEPVMRFEGTILETQIIETLALNILNFESLIATKASRLRHSAGKRMLVDFGLRRAQGLGGIHATKAAIIGGVDATSNVFSAWAFDLKPNGTMAHSWIETFGNELDAFREFARTYPDSSVFLVDTYDTLKSGIPIAIKVALEMKKDGHQLIGIRLDSGDLAYLSKRARAMLDESGLHHVKIIASNQLDERIIKSLLDQGAPVDVFGVGTSLVVGRDDAALDGVYKLSDYNQSPRLKISENIEKVTLPGSKTVYRYFDDSNMFYADAILGKEEDVIEGMFHPHQPFMRLSLKGLRREALLTEVMSQGKMKIGNKSPYELAGYAQKRLESLADDHKRFEYPHIYKVGISARLMKLRDELVRHHSIQTGTDTKKP
jgi:nicotinate phosphoribosyltransferase